MGRIDSEGSFLAGGNRWQAIHIHQKESGGDWPGNV